MKRFYAILTLCCLIVPVMHAVEGETPGTFSVTVTGKKVVFSKGNLQYQASTDTWRFAEEQYDFVGNASQGNVYEQGTKSDNAQIGESYSGWIDLFGWATNGLNRRNNAYKPYSTSDNYADYIIFGGASEGLDGTGHSSDWGMNSIINGGNRHQLWRTLTMAEWKCIIESRPNAAKLRLVARVNGVPCLILLPDNWTMPEGMNLNFSNINYTGNEISLAQWRRLEHSGAICLPAAGIRTYRDGEPVLKAFTTDGYYWSATPTTGERDVFGLHFNSSAIQADDRFERCIGASVRLVRDYEGFISNMPHYRALNGRFSVSDEQQVTFAQGNLRYCVFNNSNMQWFCPEGQWEAVGEDNVYVSSAYKGLIDLYGWGTSGYNDKYPYMTSSDNTLYGEGSNDIAGTDYDWGEYIPTINAHRTASEQWRTLTQDEWDYLLNRRPNHELLHTLGTVNDMHGLILLPDDWVQNGHPLPMLGPNDWSSNDYGSWSEMESYGAVFLPAAGRHDGGISPDMIAATFNNSGFYWTSSANIEDLQTAYALYFGINGTEAVHGAIADFVNRSNHCSVRLVRNAGTMGVENVPSDKVQCAKFLENGQLYILRDGKVFNLQGVRIQ